MRHLRHTCFALVGPAALLASACSDGTSPSSGTPRALDIASLVAQTSLAPLDSVGAALIGGIPPLTELAGISACSYAGSLQSFTCQARATNGLALSVSYTLLDAGGNPKAVADPATIDAIRVVTEFGATAQPPAGLPDGPIAHQSRRDVTMSGLLTTHYLLNGASTSSLTAFDGDGTSVMISVQQSESIVNVAVPGPGSASRWPTAGTIAMDATSTFAGSPPLTSHIAMTFTDSGVVTVVITRDSFTRSCHLNLSSPTSGQGC
jgi:hypothetical protein